MKVKCIADTGEAYRGIKMPVGYSPRSYFGGVTIGKEYTVMGLVLIENGTLLYVVDEGLPVMYPYMLFEILDSRLSPTWHFNKIKLEGSEIEAVWGYYELCFDPEHYNALVESDKNALEIYYTYKKAIEADQ